MQSDAGLPRIGRQDLQIRTPFEAQDGRRSRYPDAAVTAFVPAAETPLVRGAMALALFFVVAMTASGARVTIPGLREHTRTVVMQRCVRPPRGRRPVARALYNGRRKVARLVRRVRALSFSHRAWLRPQPILKAQRTSGQDGSMGVPRGHRWTVLGGSGRLGPGACN